MITASALVAHGAVALERAADVGNAEEDNDDAEDAHAEGQAEERDDVEKQAAEEGEHETVLGCPACCEHAWINCLNCQGRICGTCSEEVCSRCRLGFIREALNSSSLSVVVDGAVVDADVAPVTYRREQLAAHSFRDDEIAKEDQNAEEATENTEVSLDHEEVKQGMSSSSGAVPTSRLNSTIGSSMRFSIGISSEILRQNQEEYENKFANVIESSLVMLNMKERCLDNCSQCGKKRCWKPVGHLERHWCGQCCQE